MTDEEIAERIGGITFRFGDAEPSVREAVPVFVYDMGLDLDKVYVIALTENFGTVVFHLTDELVWAVSDRSFRSGVTFREYVSRLIASWKGDGGA